MQGVSIPHPPETVPRGKALLLPLTSIRCFLALWVVVLHQSSPEGWLGPSLPLLPSVVFCLFRTGYLAVSVFFILSGFVLSYNYSLQTAWSSSQLVRFGIARFARIYPAYSVGLLLIMPFVVREFLLKNFSSARLGKQIVVALLNWTLLQSWFPRTAESWNGPGWSLSNEAFFYCCFPFVGVALWRLSRLRSLVVAAGLIWGLALIAPLLAVSIPLSGFGDVPATSLLPNADPFWTSLVKFNPILRLPDFCIGVVLGRLYLELRSKHSWLLGQGYFLYVPGLLLEILAIACGKSVPYPLFHNGLLTPLHALVILGFALGGGILSRLLSMQPLVFLGNSSYAMYILHNPVAVLMIYFAKQVPFTEHRGLSGFVVYVLVVVCLSALVLKFVEEQMNRLLKKELLSRFDPQPQRVISTA